MAEDNTPRYVPQKQYKGEGNYGQLTPEDYETPWSDYWAPVGSVLTGTAAGVAADVEYLTGGALGGDTRRYFNKMGEDQVAAMSPVGRRAFESKFLPEEGEVSVLENLSSSVGLKGVAGLTSFITAVIPAGLAVKALKGASLGVRAAVAGGVTRATAGTMASGEVANQIYSEVEKVGDEELQSLSDLYAGYRSSMPEADARKLFNQDVAKVAPATAFLLSSILGGAESQVIGRYAGKAATGFVQGALTSGRKELAQETTESGVGELLAQLALTDQNLAQMNWRKILSQGIEGGVIGGVIGGGVGGVANIGGRSATVAPPPAAPVAENTALPTDPAAGTLTATSDPEAIEQLMKAEQASEPKAKKGRKAKAPTIQVSEGPDADQLAALNATNTTQQTAPEAASEVAPQPPVMAPVIPPPVADALGNLTTPRAPPPAPAPARGPEVPAPVAAAVQKQTAAPAQSEVQPISDNSGGWNYIKFGNAQVELQKDGIGWKPTDGQSTIFYATGKGPGTRRRGEAHLSGMAKAGVPAEVMPIFTDYANGKIDKDQVLEQLRGLEAKVKQRQAAAPKAPVDTGTNLQQPSADLLAEQKELISGQRAVQMFPTNTTPLKLPKGMKKSKTSRGVFHYNPDAMLPDGRKVTEGLIQRLSAMGRENELLGLGDRTKQEVAAAAPVEGGVTTVNEVTPAGDTVKSVATTVADADRQAQMLSENAAPENKVEIKPTEQALGPRVLRDVSEAGQAADAAQAEADAAAMARVAEEQKAIREKAEADAKAEANEGKVGSKRETRKISKEEKTIVEKVEAVAADAFKKFSPTANEDMFFVGGDESKLNDQDVTKAKASMVARLKAMVKAYDDGINKIKEDYKELISAGGVKTAGAIKAIADLKAAQRASKQTDEIAFILSARHFVNQRERTKSGLGDFKTFANFAGDELDFRGGSAAEQRALKKQELASKAEVVKDGFTESQTEKLVDTDLSPEARMIAAEEDVDAENFNRSKEEVEEVFAQGRDRPSAIKSKADEVLAKVRERKKKAEELAERGATEGERQAAAAAVERIAKSEETVAEKAQEIALAQFVTVARVTADQIKVSKRPKFEGGRPTVTGKVSLSRTPKAAAAVSAAQKAEPTYETGKAFVADVYHGTNEIFDRFSNAFKNSRFVSGFNSFWFAENPEVASSYTRKGLTQTQRDAGVSDIEGGNVRLSRIKMDNPFVIDMGGRRYDPIEYNRVFKQAADGGHDGIVFQNVIDGANVIGTVHAVFDENQISDKFLPSRPEGQLFPSMPTGQRARARVSAPPAGPTVSMAGVDFTPIQSTNVSRSMKMVSDDFYKMFRGGPDRLFATFFRNKLTQRVGDVPVHIVTPEDIQRIYFKATGKVGVPDGVYRNGVIALNVNTVADPVSGLEVAMHEALHAWSENAINSSPGLQRALDVMVARGLSEHRLIQDLEGQGTDRSSPYGLTDRYEFISEAFSSPDFRSFLSSVELSKADRMLIEREIGPVKGPFKTALDAFLQLLRSAMSLPDTLGNYTLLDAVMRAGAKIDAIVEQQGAGLDISAPARASITAQGIIGSSADRKNAFTSWSKRNWAKFITGGQMRQQYADTVIGPALAKIWEGVSATGPRIQQIKAEGDALATTAIDLSKKNPTEFRSLVQIMEEARMMNVNIEGANAHLGKDATKGWQAKGRLGDLQSRFAQIRDGELKQLYRDMAAYYRDSHNAIVKSSVTSILEGLELRQARGKAKGNALTEQQITDLTKRVMDQEMTAADKALLGVTVFNALKNAAAFHRIQGDYFPLMRYGDHVVTTTDKIRDTMGGKLEEPDTVLFRDKSDTAARRAAENFVKKSDLINLSVEKTYFDNVTGDEVSKDDAKSLNDVDIGYRVTMQTKGVYFFETGRAAEEFARTNPEGHDTVSNPEIRMGSGYQAQIMTGTQVASLNSAIDGRVKSKDITEGQGALLKSIVNQAATRMLGGNRIASRRLKSQKVTGASSDVARNLLQYNAAAANHIAVAENAPAIRDGLTEMTEALKGYAGNDRAQLVAVAEEVKARVDQGIVDPNAPGKVMKDIMSVSFLARLFSPAYSVINGMQPWMVTLPVLGGRFGVVDASAAMGRAYSDIGFGDAALQGVMNTARATRQAFKAALIGTDDIVGNIRKKIAKADDGADLTRMMDELIRQNAIDVTAGFEVAASAAEGRGWRGKTLAGVDRIARQLPQVVEAVNRSVSAIAAYRLARQNGQTHEQATQFALNTVQNTQGDYSAANAPRFFNNPILRPALQFKKYAQMMTYLLGDMAYRTFNGATPEERRIALKQIGNILSVQMLAAGALGLPGLEIIKAGFLLASFAGIGGGWDEVEEKLRKLLDDSTNKTFGELVSSGILSRAIGIDVSQRMSLADMWLFGEPKGDTSESIEAYLFRQVVGAPGSLLLDARNGLVLAVEGEWGKAAGKLIPIKFAADFAKAAHNSSESEYEKADKKKVSGPGEFALNVFGFRSGRQAELGRTKGADIKKSQERQKEYKKLSDAYYKARTKGDQMKAIARNREWNASLPDGQFKLKLPVKPRELRTAQ